MKLIEYLRAYNRVGGTGVHSRFFHSFHILSRKSPNELKVLMELPPW